MIITGVDSQAVISALGYICLLGFLVGLFIASCVYTFYKRILRQLKFPNRVKTENGFLYRTDKGLYVQKSLLEQHNFAFQRKNHQRWIAFYERRIAHLKNKE